MNIIASEYSLQGLFAFNIFSCFPELLKFFAHRFMVSINEVQPRLFVNKLNRVPRTEIQ